MSARVAVQAQSTRRQRVLNAVPDHQVSLAPTKRMRHVKTRQRVRPDHPRTYGDRYLMVVPDDISMHDVYMRRKAPSITASVAASAGSGRGHIRRDERIRTSRRDVRGGGANVRGSSTRGGNARGNEKRRDDSGKTLYRAFARPASSPAVRPSARSGVHIVPSMTATHSLLTAPMRIVLGIGLMVGAASLIFVLGLYASLGLGVVG